MEKYGIKPRYLIGYSMGEITALTCAEAISFVDALKILKENYNKSRRITRGLFKTYNNLKINTDLNGSINILRKYIKNNCIPKLIKSVMDNGCEDYPIRIRVA